MKFKLIPVYQLIKNFSVKIIAVENADFAFKVLDIFNDFSRFCLPNSKFIFVKPELLCYLDKCF